MIKLNLQKEVAKKSNQSLTKSPEIKPINGFNIAVFRYMNSLTGEQNENTLNMCDFIENNRQNYKKLTIDNQLKLLFYHIKNESKNGLYKRPSLSKLGEFLNIHRDTVKDRLNLLVDKGYLGIATDIDIQEMKNTYKLLKEDY